MTITVRTDCNNNQANKIKGICMEEQMFNFVLLVFVAFVYGGWFVIRATKGVYKATFSELLSATIHFGSGIITSILSIALLFIVSRVLFGEYTLDQKDWLIIGFWLGFACLFLGNLAVMFFLRWNGDRNKDYL